jgi:hypothetical protein
MTQRIFHQIGTQLPPQFALTLNYKGRLDVLEQRLAILFSHRPISHGNRAQPVA